MEGWLGGDILKVSNAFMVTDALKSKLIQCDAKGIETYEKIEIESSDTFRNLYPNRSLPKLKRIVINGLLGVDDFVVKDHMKLLVSEKGLSILNEFDVSDLEIVEVINSKDHPA